MANYLSKEKKAEIFREYAGTAENTGSTAGQIALFTYRIQSLSQHLQTNKQDHSCRRALLGLVGKRKRLLQYLQDTDLHAYRALIEKLGLRK
jgi:small subunit ribosomal protein S15